MRKYFIAGSVVAAILIAACTTVQKNVEAIGDSPSARNVAGFWGGPSGSFFANNDALVRSKASSSDRLNLSRARLIIDNDEAFLAKLHAIENAREYIDMAYFIYSDDESSSKINQALIAAAQRGVKVQILVDLSTNYGHMDLYHMLEKEGGGNITVKMYNPPTANIIKDAIYTGSHCSDEVKAKTNTKNVESSSDLNACVMVKMAIADKLAQADAKGSFFSRLLLAGYYGKSAGALKLVVGAGTNADVAGMMKLKASASDKDKDDLEDVGRLLKKAKESGSQLFKLDIANKFKSNPAIFNPLYSELFSDLPLSKQSVQGKADADHITDYLHHKLLLVDSKIFELGGRNIENSYHIKKENNHGISKPNYVFSDTDFYGEVDRASGDQIRASYERLFNFAPTTATLAELDNTSPFEFVQNVDIVQLAIGSCYQKGLQKAPSDQLDGCVAQTYKGLMAMPDANFQGLLSTLPANFKNTKRSYLDYRIADAKTLMKSNASSYDANYKADFSRTWKQDGSMSDDLVAADVSGALISYLENLPFNKNANPLVRTYGATTDLSGLGTLQINSGKNIHSLWNQGLYNVCSDKSLGRKQVIIHSAYYLLPAETFKIIADMVTGKISCGNVDVSILTNSTETTDLSIVNIFAEHQTAALLRAVGRSNSKPNAAGFIQASSRSAAIRYLEYNKSFATSLHTKLMIIGNDMIDGSCNADVRSYHMDSNDAVYIRNAKDLVANYTAYFNKVAVSDIVTNRTAQVSTLTHAQLTGMDKAVVVPLMLWHFMVEKPVSKGKVDAASGFKFTTALLPANYPNVTPQDILASFANLPAPILAKLNTNVAHINKRLEPMVDQINATAEALVNIDYLDQVSDIRNSSNPTYEKQKLQKKMANDFDEQFQSL